LVEPRLLLVHLLRDHLGLTGTHVGCDTTNCAACTVHLDGKAVKSCTVPAVQADGSEVTTSRNPDPSEEEVRHGLEGNLCRCTGFAGPVVARAHQRAHSDHCPVLGSPVELLKAEPAARSTTLGLYSRELADLLEKGTRT